MKRRKLPAANPVHGDAAAEGAHGRQTSALKHCLACRKMQTKNEVRSLQDDVLRGMHGMDRRCLKIRVDDKARRLRRGRKTGVWNMAELTIRKMNMGDTEALYELLSNAAVMEFLEPPFSRAKAIRFLRENGLSSPPRVLAVDDENGVFIGYVIFHDYDDFAIEIGWVLKPEVWGMGLAAQLTAELIWAARKQGKDAVIECAPEQLASKCIALRFGFTYAGRIDGLDLYRRDHRIGI